MVVAPMTGLFLRPALGKLPQQTGVLSQILRYSTRVVPSDRSPSGAGPADASQHAANGPVTKTTNSEIPAWAKPISCQTSTTAPRKQRKPKWKATFDAYMELTKPRLTALVVLSAMSSYALVPSGGSLTSLGVLTVGTALCSASANSINQGREPEFDRQMTRTRKRPVASYRLTSQQAFAFAGLCGISGVSLLGLGTNWTVGLLGLANILLYGITYTSMKRTSILNTWVGAIVGAIPPLMGWATCASLATPGPWILAGLLYSWQFPHFMSLSYSIADEYKRAGYVMSAWTNPLLTARVALRHSLFMFPLCFAASYFGLTDNYFAFDSSLVNGWMTYAAFKFWQQQRRLRNVAPSLYKHSGEYKQHARLLFLASVIHLPLVLLLAMMHKKGQWDWLVGPSKPDHQR